MSRIIKTKIIHNGPDSRAYLQNLKKSFIYDNLKKIAEESLDDFKKASPTSEIASNWGYYIEKNNNNFILIFENSTIINGENIAIIIDAGHGTVSGKWVPGTNYLKEPVKKTYERINNLFAEAQQ